MITFLIILQQYEDGDSVRKDVRSTETMDSVFITQSKTEGNRYCIVDHVFFMYFH